MRTVREKEYAVTYTLVKCTYELTNYYLAESMEEAIRMCREANEGCFIKEVRYLHEVKRKSTKTITVEV